MVERTFVIVKAVAFDDQNRILLIRRSKTAPRRALQWDLPGGFVDDEDESYRHTCLRELYEETGLKAAGSVPQLSYAESSIDAHGNGSWLYFTVSVTLTDVRLSYEHDKFMWAPLQEALTLITYDKQRRALIHIQRAYKA
ncbi:MAG TPA: NUDIX hydrolase [Verrucomicrobiae bacterium]|nr:NUDIX hydrolase [Verrucomicrobiae bacterium]